MATLDGDPEKEFDTTFKILVLGDSGVGKTCLIFRFTEDVFSDSYISTIGECFAVLNEFYNGFLGYTTAHADMYHCMSCVRNFIFSSAVQHTICVSARKYPRISRNVNLQQS